MGKEVSPIETTGTVLRTAGGIYPVYSQGKVFLCQARGKVRTYRKIVCGDLVRLKPTDGNRGIIEEIVPEKNLFMRIDPHTRKLRPFSANVEIVLVVFSTTKPDPDLYLIDRFLAFPSYQKIPSILIFNKIDLKPPGEEEKLYKLLRYPFFSISALTGEGVQDLLSTLPPGIVVLIGPSGTGKSKLINTLAQKEIRKVGELRKKTETGKHTTSSTELIPIHSGEKTIFLVDTPGFSKVGFPPLPLPSVQEGFPEIFTSGKGCQYPSCLHRGEDGCKVREEVEKGKIAPSRYRSYLSILKEIEEIPSYTFRENL
jgi:ribosome biogenesis GTPase